ASSRWAATASPTSSAAPARSCSPTLPRTSPARHSRSTVVCSRDCCDTDMSVARNILLALSTNAWLRDRATKTAFVRRSVSAFMPGERLEDAMAAAGQQEAAGVGTIFTKLGENVTHADEAEAVTAHYLDVLDQVQRAGLRAQISVKPTQLGLDLDQAMCVR